MKKEECKHEYFLEGERRESIYDKTDSIQVDKSWEVIKTFRCKFCLKKVEETELFKQQFYFRSLR